MQKVCVLLSTYNGEKFLEELLNSVINQNGVEVILFARDDGSSDKTHSKAGCPAGTSSLFLLRVSYEKSSTYTGLVQRYDV